MSKRSFQGLALLTRRSAALNQRKVSVRPFSIFPGVLSSFENMKVWRKDFLVQHGQDKISSRSFSKFYKSNNNEHQYKDGDDVFGEALDHSVDLEHARPGDVINVPYELTINSSFRDFWQSAFYSHDRINTSTPFARKLGFQDQVMPFSLMLFLCGSMSHADNATVQVGFKNAIYHWPVFAGDTMRKKFIVKSVRSSSNNKFSIFTFFCELSNQRDTVVFTADKTMIFPFPVSECETEFPVTPPVKQLEDHLVSRADSLGELGSHSLQAFRPGQLLFHSMVRPLSGGHSMQLASMARLTHERHFNNRKYNREEMYIPGGLVLGLTFSSAARDLHEVLHDELLECSYINNLHPWDTVSAFTFIKSMDENITGDLESLHIRTIGVKNMDLVEELKGKPIPLDLLTKSTLRTKAVETICKDKIPELSKKIVSIVDRKILRQSPKQEAFLL